MGSSGGAAVFGVPTFDIVAFSRDGSERSISLDHFVLGCTAGDDVFILTTATDPPSMYADPSTLEAF